MCEIERKCKSWKNAKEKTKLQAECVLEDEITFIRTIWDFFPEKPLRHSNEISSNSLLSKVGFSERDAQVSSSR